VGGGGKKEEKKKKGVIKRENKGEKGKNRLTNGPGKSISIKQ
jgi:hypothetical protein